MDRKLTNGEWFRLDWFAKNEGCPAKENRGRVFDTLLAADILIVRDGRIYLTEAGKLKWQEG